MINTAVLLGRLTRDPELRKTASGKSNLQFILAVDRDFKSEGQPDADFINCVAWGKTAETMAEYLTKGSFIGVEGRIQTRNYENNQGQRVYVTGIIVNRFNFLESKNVETKSNSVYLKDEKQVEKEVFEDDTLEIDSDALPF